MKEIRSAISIEALAAELADYRNDALDPAHLYHTAHNAQGHVKVGWLQDREFKALGLMYGVEIFLTWNSSLVQCDRNQRFRILQSALRWLLRGHHSLNLDAGNRVTNIVYRSSVPILPLD